MFDADLTASRVADTAVDDRAGSLRRATQTLRVSLLIYTHALRLWAKGATFHPHPDAVALRDRRRQRPGPPTAARAEEHPMTDLLIDEPTGDLDPGAAVSRPVVAAVPSLPAVDPSRLLDHRPAATRLP